MAFLTMEIGQWFKDSWMVAHTTTQNPWMQYFNLFEQITKFPTKKNNTNPQDTFRDSYGTEHAHYKLKHKTMCLTLTVTKTHRNCSTYQQLCLEMS